MRDVPEIRIGNLRRAIAVVYYILDSTRKEKHMLLNEKCLRSACVISEEGDCRSVLYRWVHGKKQDPKVLEVLISVAFITGMAIAECTCTVSCSYRYR